MFKDTGEQSNQGEKTTPRQIFELLYPENSFSRLPGFDPRNVGHMLDKYLGIGGFLKVNQNVNLIAALEFGEEYAARVSMGYPDKFTLSHQFKGLIPVSEKTHGVFFKGKSFDDILKQEEHLGGVASKKISQSIGTPSAHLIALIEGAKFYAPDVYFIGVLNAKNLPSGLIVFYEGEGKKQKVKEPNSSLAPKPNLQLDATIS